MAKSKEKLKKVIKTSPTNTEKKYVAQSSTTTAKGDLLYGKEFYMWMLIGLACIILGFVLMGGGNQAPKEWNADEIYSFRRTALAPIVIIIGLVIEVYAIFKK